MTTAHTPTLIGSAEVCEQLGGIDRSTLSRWVAAGKITPAMKLPGERGAFLFHATEVERAKTNLGIAA